MTMTLPRAAARGTPAPVPPGAPGGGAEGRKRARGSAERAALLTLTAAIVFQPLLHPTGPKNTSPVDIFTIVSVGAAAIWVAVSRRKLRAPYFFPAALYMAAGAASGLVSPLPSTSLITLVKDVLLFAWLLTVVNVLGRAGAMRRALAAWSWSGIFWAAIVVVAWLGHITPVEGLSPADGNRVLFTFGDPNYASFYWVSTFFVVFAARTPAKRWMRLAGYGLLLWALLLSESNGGMLALMTGVMFLALIRAYRRRGWPAVAAIALSAGIVGGAFFVNLSSIRQWAAHSGQPLLVNSIGRSAQSSSERATLVGEAIELYQRSDGVLGLGPATTKPLLAQWLYPYANEAHDDYLAALCERGALGLFAFLLLAWCAASRASPIIRRPLSPPFAAAVPRPAGIVAGLLALGLNSFYEEIQDVRFLWLLLGIVAVLGLDASRQRRREPAHAWGAGALPPAWDGEGNRARPPAWRPPGESALPPAWQPGGAVLLPALPGNGPGGSRARHPAGAAGTAATLLGRGRRSRRPVPDGLMLPGPPAGLPGLAGLARPGGSGPGRQRGGSRLLSRHAISNLGAQGGALAAVSLASLLVARTGGPTVVGEYALLRVLPWLFGVVFSCGLPTASAFFLADQRVDSRRLRPTLSLMAVAGAALGSLAWLGCATVFHDVFFRQIPLRLVAVMTIVVVTQLWTVTAKGCCQGSGDIPGANLIIVAEELWFVGVYPGVLLLYGYHRTASVVLALVISGLLATATGLACLCRNRFFTGWGAPSRTLAARVAAFGGRGQLGNMLWLMNLRFDVILLGALAGPAVVGIYSVASKAAELMRLAPTAINYVLYPRFARLDGTAAAGEAGRLLPRSAALTIALTPVLALAAYVGLPIVYGRAFDAAVLPAEIIVIGLSVEGAAAVASAFLLGRGRPGLNSAGMGLGTVITVALDVILIPRYGALGGAITSAVTYLATTTVLVFLTRRMVRAAGPRYRGGEAGWSPEASRAGLRRMRPRRDAGADTGPRRMVDILVAGSMLTVLSPVLLLIAVAVKLTSDGPVLYRQVRAGRSREPFTILKFRSMVCGADRGGPLITGRSDPRVTRTGALLRATKLDELPQLVNVLRGDMTLIGPRPEVLRFIPCYDEEELAVLSVRPGMTGAGQVFFSTAQEAACQEADDPELRYVLCELHPKLAIDLDYLRRRGLRADLGILLRTVLLMADRGRHQGLSRTRPAVSCPGSGQARNRRTGESRLTWAI